MKKRGLITRAYSRLARDLSLPVMIEMPRFVQLVPTNACNLRCRACPKTHYKTNVDHIMPEVYERVRQQAYGNAETLSLQGLGEPTLAPLFTQMLEDALRLDMHVVFVTNASKLTSEHIALLARMRATVCVSIDGATAETHEFSRVGSKFSQVLGVLEELREARRGRPDCRMTVQFSTVLTRRALPEIPDLIAMADRYDVSMVVILDPGVADRQDEFALDAIGHHHELFRSWVPKMREAESRSRTKLLLPPYIEALAAAPPGEGATPQPAARRSKRIFPQKCFAPFRDIYIEPDGWIRPCCAVGVIAMGNILDDDLKTIWNNKHYRRLRRTINTDNPPEFCRTCPMHGGITAGNARFLEDLYRQGAPPLPPARKLGYYYSEKDQKVYEY